MRKIFSSLALVLSSSLLFGCSGDPDQALLDRIEGLEEEIAEDQKETTSTLTTQPATTTTQIREIGRMDWGDDCDSFGAPCIFIYPTQAKEGYAQILNGIGVEDADEFSACTLELMHEQTGLSWEELAARIESAKTWDGLEEAFEDVPDPDEKDPSFLECFANLSESDFEAIVNANNALE